MRRLLFFVVAVVLICSSCAIAQTWNYALSGGYYPALAKAPDGNSYWLAYPWSGGARWESVPSDNSTALRIIDTDTTKKIQWLDYYRNTFRENASAGMTVSFRIKFETSALASGSATTYSMMKFTTQLVGAPCRHKFQLSLKNDATLGHCLSNNDYANGLDGVTPALLRVEDHEWHTYRLLLTAAPDGSNNGRYQVYWDGVLVQDYKRNSTETFAGEFGTDASANVFTYQLDYFGVSTDGAWTLQQLADPGELMITSGPTVNMAPDKSTAAITWQTNENAQVSRVHYGDTPQCLETATEAGGPSASHSVTIPVGEFKYIYWYLESTSPVSPTVRTDVTTINTGVVQNMGFEDATQDPWVKIDGYSFDGISSGDKWGFWPHTGGKKAVTAVSSGKADRGGLYQIITGLTPGGFYEVSAWIWTKVATAPEDPPPGDSDAACRVGVDPTASTYVGGWNGETWVENANITWSPWTASDNSAGPDGGPWKKISCAVKAVGTTATIYIQQLHRWGFLWNITGFDDVWVTQAPPPPAGIAAAKAVQDGFPAFLPDKIVTAAWPGDKRFYVEEEDRASAIKVTVPTMELVPAVGSKVTVSGYMGSNQHGDRYVGGTEVTPNGTATVPKPFAMNNKAVGDKANSAMLITVCGKVLDNPDLPGSAEYYPGYDSQGPGYDPYLRNYMYIDDGSNITADYMFTITGDPAQWSSYGQYKGLKVYYPSSDFAPQPGQYVICTGVAGYELCDSNFTDEGGTFSLVRTIEVRQSNSIDEGSTPQNFNDVLVYPVGSF